jgi:hypothetical protein
VTKRFDRHRHYWGGQRYAYERRVNELLNRQPPPVAAPRLLSADRRQRSLMFTAVDGKPLGEKFPLDLGDEDVDGLIALATTMDRYRPVHTRFVRRFDLARRIERAIAVDALTRAEGEALRARCRADPPEYAFAHGDITARNVVRRRCDGELVLIDWEWFGRYPRGWELAFVWFTVIDSPGARARVESAVPEAGEEWFWRSALLIQTLHLELPGLAPGSPFRANHLRTREELVARVLGEQ